MSPLDINQSDKAVKQIAVKAFEVPGNQYAKGIYNNSKTKALGYDDWLMSVFYFPVDCSIWSLGAQFNAQVNRSDANSHYETHYEVLNPGEHIVVSQPTNAEGMVEYGISLFSERDLPWTGTPADPDTGAVGMTPMTPATKVQRLDKDTPMVWSGFASDTEDSTANMDVEVATVPRGWTNKASRQLLHFGMHNAPGSKTINFDMTKKVRRRGKKSQKRAFDVSAGQKLVFWIRNVTGVGDTDRELKVSAGIAARVQFFPKEDIIQNYTYRDQASQRWASSTAMKLDLTDGDGVNDLWRTRQANGSQTGIIP